MLTALTRLRPAPRGSRLAALRGWTGSVAKAEAPPGLSQAAFAGLAERFDAPGAGLHTWGALRDGLRGVSRAWCSGRPDRM